MDTSQAPKDDLEFIALRLTGAWDKESLEAFMDDLQEMQAAAKDCGLGIRVELIRKPAKASGLIMPPALKPKASRGGLLLAGPGGSIREVDK